LARFYPVPGVPTQNIMPPEFSLPPPQKKKKTHLNNNDLVAFVKSSVGTFFFFSSYEKRVENMEGKQKKKNRKDATGWPKLRGHPLIARKPWDYKDRP